MKRLFTSIALALAMLTGSIAAWGFFVDETRVPFTALPGATAHFGVLNGAAYHIEIPDNWNGSLVLYAHGFVDARNDKLVAGFPRIRQFLIQNGYAWAASSYSKNGYVVKEGVLDTHDLGEFFKQTFGEPKKIYFTGHSMGGHITGVAIERFPHDYVAAMPMCGVMGDVKLFDYFLSYNLVAQTLAGVTFDFPAPQPADTVFQPIARAKIEPALGAPFPNLMAIPPVFGALNAQGEKLRAATWQMTGGDRPFRDLAFAVWADFLFGRFGDGTVGVANGNVTTNIGDIYQFDSDPFLTADEIDLNENVARIAPDFRARFSHGAHQLENIPPIQANFHIPVLTMHTIGDLFVPFSMEQIYHDRAALHGRSDRLVQRAIRDVGHCAWSAAEEEKSFADLVGWETNGVEPAGDQVTDKAAVADPNFGCQFTMPQFHSPALPQCSR